VVDVGDDRDVADVFSGRAQNTLLLNHQILTHKERPTSGRVLR
jgi:hypothetical protein